MSTAEAIPNSVALFNPEATLLSILDYKYEVVSSKTVLDANVRQLEFTINEDKISYTDLNNSLLLIKCGYTKDDGSTIESPPKIGPCNYLLTTMIKSVDIWLNDVKITPPETNVAYTSYLYAYTQPKQAQKTLLTLGLYYADDESSRASLNQSNPNATADKNSGLTKRASFFDGGKKVTLLGKIYAPPHTTTRYYPPHCKFDYRIELNDMAFFSMSGEPAGTYKFQIDEAAFLAKRVRLSPALELAHSQMLQTQNAIYPVRFLESRTYNIPTGSYDFQFPNCFIGRNLPRVIFIALIKAASKSGSLKENPFVFDTVDMEEIYCKLGSKKVPTLDYKLNIDDKQSQIALWETYVALDYFGGTAGPGSINRETFNIASFLVGIDLSRDQAPNSGYRNSSIDASSISIEGKLRAPTKSAYCLLVLGLIEGSIEIDRFYQPFTSYG